MPLEKQNLLPTTKELLTVLYRDYMCDDIEKKKLNEILNENEIKYQNYMREKYNPDNIFKNREKTKENAEIIAYKESFFFTFIRRIKKQYEFV